MINPAFRNRAFNSRIFGGMDAPEGPNLEHPDNRLPRMSGVAHHLAILAIYKQICFFQCSLTNQNLIADNEAVLGHFTSEDIKYDSLADRNLFRSPIGKRDRDAISPSQSQFVSESSGNCALHGACIN